MNMNIQLLCNFGAGISDYYKTPKSVTFQNREKMKSSEFVKEEDMSNGD